MSKKVYILAGISGSGKSTAARKLQEANPRNTIIASADAFMVDDAGEWNFDPTKLGICHSLCQEKFHAALRSKIANILVDNTNLVNEHRVMYVEHALAAGYEVITLVFDTDIDTALSRNIHQVPRHTLENQRKKLDLKPGIYTQTFEPTRTS